MKWSRFKSCLGNTCSLHKMYNHKLLPHPLPPGPAASALAVKDPLPARVCRLFVLGLPWRRLKKNTLWTEAPHTGGWGITLKSRTGSSTSSHMHQDLTVQRIRSVIPNKKGAETSLKVYFLVFLLSSWFYLHIFISCLLQTTDYIPQVSKYTEKNKQPAESLKKLLLLTMGSLQLACTGCPKSH